MKAILIIVYLVVCMRFNVNAQVENWQNLDLKKDNFFGVSTERAYSEILGGKKGGSVIVAVVDSGTDTTHEDLRSAVWTSPLDGRHGKSYMGYESGKEDLTNLATVNKRFYDSLAYTKVPETYKAGYKEYRFISAEYLRHVQGMRNFVNELEQSEQIVQRILDRIGNDNPSVEEFKKYKPQGDAEQQEREGLIIKLIIGGLTEFRDFKTFRKHELDDLLCLANHHLRHGLNMKDVMEEAAMTATNNDADVSPGFLGLLSSPNYTPFHGTHVAGIIGAARNNGIGMNGVADNVQIMTLKVLSNIRELRDENLADAIKFAVDNGAKVINLSFGKPYTVGKNAVDSAVKYAMEKDVVIIHAAGNEGRNLDNSPHFPNPVYSDSSGEANAWIEVGASGPKNDSTLVPSFSNYGEKTVDVFAPGVNIYSTIPRSEYISYNGTSMAAPVVAGLAALLREYHPLLTAKQVKEIIMQSVIKVDHDVRVKDAKGEMISVPFSKVCISGGIVNVYNAFKLAERYN